MISTHTITLAISSTQGYTATIEVPGNGDLVHLAGVFELALQAMGLSALDVAEANIHACDEAEERSAHEWTDSASDQAPDRILNWHRSCRAH